MKTSWELEIPSKLYLLRDLARGISEGGRLWGAYAEISKLSKSLENPCGHQTANAVVVMLAVMEHPGQGKNRGVECD
jgi:hypothetical protein